MAGEGGNIVRNVFGKSYKEAEHIMKDASKGTLDFKSPQENTFYGKKGGKKFDEYQAKEQTKQLQVKAVKCYEDFACTKEVKIIKKGVKYYFKAIQYSRTPTKSELKGLKWAIQYDGTPLASASQVTGEEKISYIVPQDRKISKLKVYAFFKAPDEKVRAEVSFKILDPIIIYICGYWNKKMPYAGSEWGEQYWGIGLKSSAKKYFKSTKEYFINGAGTKFSSGGDRYKQGKEFAEARLKSQASKFYQEIFKEERRIMVVSHSMGGAFAEGVLSVFKNQKLNIEKVVHLSPADTSGFSVTFPQITYQIDIDLDPVLMYKNANDSSTIRGVKFSGISKNPKGDEFGHMYTKDEAFVWGWFEDLELIEFQFVNQENKTYTTPGSGMGYGGTSTTVLQKNFNALKVKSPTPFSRVYKNSKFYFYDEKTKKYYTEN